MLFISIKVMSKNIEENKAFLKLFLNTTKAQQKALLYTLTDTQVRVLKEIIYNLRNFKLPRKPTKTIKRRAIVRLSKSTTSLTQARKLVKKNFKDIIDIFVSVKDELAELLK